MPLSNFGGRMISDLEVKEGGLRAPSSRVAQYLLRSHNNSSSGYNLTPYSGVILGGVILTPKRSLKNSFSGAKVTPDIEELK